MDVSNWSAESNEKAGEVPLRPQRKETDGKRSEISVAVGSVSVKPQTYKNIAIVPLIAPADGTFQYRTLGEALAAGDFAITETSANGSVPELMVVNRANKPCLRLTARNSPAPSKTASSTPRFCSKKPPKPNPGQLHRGRQMVLRLQGSIGNVMAYRTGPERPSPSTAPWPHPEPTTPTRVKSGMALPTSRPKPAPTPPPPP